MSGPFSVRKYFRVKHKGINDTVSIVLVVSWSTHIFKLDYVLSAYSFQYALLEIYKIWMSF